jgi:YebC/PmpR family DNA-binding regulatory protein
MAGHSHWANIQHKKGIADAKRGRLWSKLSRLIIVAAKHGGGDPETNLKLRYAIDKAREVSMPKDNIERAIKRGTGELVGDQMEELQYEGFGPEGIAILVDVVTDNRNRTSGEVRKIFERGGGKMGSAGSVSFLFDRKGLIVVPRSAIDEDSLMALAIDAGADDVKTAGDNFEVLCEPTAFAAVKKAITDRGLEPSQAEIVQIPKVPKEVDVETGKRVLKLVEALDEHDDVQNVYTDMQVTEAMLTE